MQRPRRGADADGVGGAFGRRGGRVLFEGFEDDFDRLVELRVVAGGDGGGVLLDFDVGGDAFVLDDPAVLGEDRQVGAVTAAAVHQHREPEDADQAPPGPLADQRAELELAEHPGEQVAAGAGGLVDDHHLGAGDRRVGRAQRLAVAGRPVADHGTAEQVDVVVGDLAAAVEPLVDDRRVLVGLGIEVPLEVRVSLTRRVGDVDVRHAPLGPLVDLVQVPLDPGPVAEAPASSAIGSTIDGAGVGAVGLGADLQLGPTPDGLLEVLVDLGVGLHVLAVDGQQVIADFDVHPGRVQRGAERGVPVGAAVDRLEPEPAVGDLVVGAEQSHGDRFGLVQPVAAEQVAVPDRQLAEHRPDHPVEVVRGSPGGAGTPRTWPGSRPSRPRACSGA